MMLMMDNLALWVIWSLGRVVDHYVMLEWAAQSQLLVDSHRICDEEVGWCMWQGRLNSWGQISTFSRSDVIKYCSVGMSGYDTV